MPKARQVIPLLKYLEALWLQMTLLKKGRIIMFRIVHLPDGVSISIEKSYHLFPTLVSNLFLMQFRTYRGNQKADRLKISLTTFE